MSAQTDINQIIISSAPAGSSTVYVDNVYFSKVPSIGTDEFEISKVNIYPNPTSNSWNINSDYTIENVLVYDVSGKVIMTLTPNTLQTIIDASSLNAGIYFAKIETAVGVKDIKLIKR